MILDRGLNDFWRRTVRLRKIKPSHYRIRLREPLGQAWSRETISLALPRGIPYRNAQVTQRDGTPVASQISGGRLFLRIENLTPGETRDWDVRFSKTAPPRELPGGVFYRESGPVALFGNRHIAVKLPGSLPAKAGARIPGPLLAIRRSGGAWMGEGYLESSRVVSAIRATLRDAGPLWAECEVVYEFAEGAVYRMRLRLGAEDEVMEIDEESTLPLCLRPGERPYREIGTLGSSSWRQASDHIAQPCIRPIPSSWFVLAFGLREANRLVTHSTGAWEIMDFPLGGTTRRAFTAMRAAYTPIDGGWLGLHHTEREGLLGVASRDLAHWRLPDDTLHPIHKMPGAHAEVFFFDGPAGGEYRFPIENLSRSWLLGAFPQTPKPLRRTPLRRAADPTHPLWAQRIRRGDLPLDKVKDWVTDWPEPASGHVGLLCAREDFGSIREKVLRSPALLENFQRFRVSRPVDRHILLGEVVRLSEIEAQIGARRLVEETLERGYSGPNYAIALSRPLRRYVIACDVLWENFNEAERREARHVCALAAYFLTDGDWWQYAWCPGETTYLPNFNSDVFACAGLMGLFLEGHPCSGVWIQGCLARIEREFAQHLRADGCGDENIGCYYYSTWTQIYFPLLWALRRRGQRDYSADPRIHAAARYMIETLTPPDPRRGGLRMIPPIGDHPGAAGRLQIMDWLATFVQDTAPELAQNLKWAWQECGSPVGNFHDHFGEAANPFTRHNVFHNPEIAPRKPTLGTRDFTPSGAVLRTEGESYVFLKSGRIRYHHHDDEGSFHYYGRGVPLALDALSLSNGQPGTDHNKLTFEGGESSPARGERTRSSIERLVSTPTADYVRIQATVWTDPDAHRTNQWKRRNLWERSLILVRASRPGGAEYLVIKDSTLGPDAATWNLDVLSRKPIRSAKNRLWFPGMATFAMGLEVIFAAPASPEITLEKGGVDPLAFEDWKRKTPSVTRVSWKETEHWLAHAAAPANSGFLTVLFPRRKGEASPVITYMESEGALQIRHFDGEDILFLPDDPEREIRCFHLRFQGAAGLASRRSGSSRLEPLDARIFTPPTYETFGVPHALIGRPIRPGQD